MPPNPILPLLLSMPPLTLCYLPCCPLLHGKVVLRTLTLSRKLFSRRLPNGTTWYVPWKFSNTSTILHRSYGPVQSWSRCACLPFIFDEIIFIYGPLQPGGHLFLSTIARTPLSYILTILFAETILRK